MERLGQLMSGASPDWTWAGTAAVCTAGALVLVFKWTGHQHMMRKLSRARDRRESSLNQAEKAVLRFREENPGVDTASIVSLSLEELIHSLQEGALPPSHALHAYMEKMLEVNKNLNCCTDVLLEAFEQLDATHTHTPTASQGLLYGVPISIKDNLGYKGHDSTCGVLCKLEEPALMDSVVVSVLKTQGAVPFVKTNVPQGLLNYDCSNPIYGQSKNPRNQQKTCGGSSGGEGALIGGGGSILGLGTDIAGSIRIPAAFCGICGFKPTSGRLSLLGANSCSPGQKSVLSSVGPMARDVSGLAVCMRALLCEEMFCLDPTVPPLPFNQQVYESRERLRIGYYENDGYLTPSPSMARALRETRALLEGAGHTLVPFRPPRLFHAMHELAAKGILADGAATLLSHLRGGPVDPCLRPQTLPYCLPRPVKRLLSLLLRPLFPRIAASLAALCGVSSVPDLWKQHKDVEEYTHETIAEWRRLQLDVLLCPMLGPAYNFYYCGKLTSALSYTMLYNLVNFPAGVVPVSMVTEEDEAQLAQYTGNYGDIWDKFFVQAVKGSVGLPVAVQCISLPWQDEMCLRLMREVEQLSRDTTKTHTP